VSRQDDAEEPPGSFDDHERSGPTTAAEALLVAFRVPDLSDEAWAVRDAEVAASKLADETAAADAAVRIRAQSLKTASGFPARSVDAALEAGETTAMAAARRFLQAKRSVLVLAGGVGAGKTTASAWLALEAGGSIPAFIRAAELESRGRYDRELRAWLRGKTMLVIDDIGAESLDGKGNFQSLLDEIVDLFYGDRKLVVMTTNLRPKTTDPKVPQFNERYGERIASRLFEVGTWADCGTTDLRRKPLTKTTDKED